MADVEKGKNPTDFGWAAPTQNVDGSAINGPLNYNLYRAGSESITVPDDLFFVVIGNLQTDGTYRAPLDQFPTGRSVIALSAVDADGDESALSNTLGFSVTDGLVPSPPVLSA